MGNVNSLQLQLTSLQTQPAKSSSTPSNFRFKNLIIVNLHYRFRVAFSYANQQRAASEV